VVFAVLGSSSLPVLRSIGVTVVLGVVSNFMLSQLLIRPGERP
jgi:predicted exporter